LNLELCMMFQVLKRISIVCSGATWFSHWWMCRSHRKHEILWVSLRVSFSNILCFKKEQKLGCISVVQHLPSMHLVLSSTRRITKKDIYYRMNPIERKFIFLKVKDIL
jgi:hypothetical protein